MESYESKIKKLKIRMPLITIWSIYGVTTTTLLVWFEPLYPFQIPTLPELNLLALIRWLILLTTTVIALVTSVGYLLWKIKKLKEPPEPVLSPFVQEIINKVIDDKINDKEIS